MSIKLQSGANFALAVTAPSVNKFIIGLDWQSQAQAHHEFDIDGSCFLLDGNSVVAGNHDFIFYNQLQSVNSAVCLMDTPINGGKVGFSVDLSQLPDTVNRVVFCLTLHNAEEKRQSFGQIAWVNLAIINSTTQSVIAEYRCENALDKETAILVGEFYRHNQQWKFKAIGQGYNNGLSALAKNFGVDISDEAENAVNITQKKFDLNIEKILENWEIYHAVREIIANALDEQLLTNTRDIEITKQSRSWVIRDFGRGLKYTHLTQNENQEKLDNGHVIGKFGIGLKDAMATFDRRNIAVVISSAHNIITTSKSSKQDFQDIVTLHAIIDEPQDRNFSGTKVELIDLSDSDIDSAKKLFLRFSGETITETTRYGQVINKTSNNGNIYINGVKVSEEDNFLFSYNITALSAPIKKALNRERTHVGRTAYADSVKKILLSSSGKPVAERLAADLKNITMGTAHDELAWIDVQEHSVKILNQQGKYLFVTAFEAMQHTDMMDQARNGGHEIITIPENLKLKIQGSTDLSGNQIMGIGQFVDNYNDSFEFNVITDRDMSSREKAVYQLTPEIIRLFGGMPNNVAAVKISTTMQTDFFSGNEALGCWDERTRSIVVSRKMLRSLADYAGVLVHELVHAKTGYYDVTRPFETALTEQIGKLCEQALKSGGAGKPWYNALFG